MRHFLISALLLSLLAGCSSLTHHIDVQQGNALDQENVARLKVGLNRSQVRFLLGTPLIVDPFRTDRWDYVYLYYKAGKLTEQKRISLFFEGDTLARIEGDLPEPAAQPETATVEPQPAPATPTAPAPAAAPLAAEPVAQPAPIAPEPSPAPAAPVAAPVEQTKSPGAEPVVKPSGPETSIVPSLPSPKDVPAYVDPQPVPELSLKAETDVTQIKPDAIPPFPVPHAAAVASNDPVLKSLNAWADAWARRDSDAYFAAYDDSFVPQDGGSRDAWEARKRQVLDAAKSIEVKIDSPSVEQGSDGNATVTFKQYYRSGSYHDAVVKQVRMVERGGRWLIAEEKVLSVLKDGRP
jgi:outer membrane protein assembly factor BamE